MRLDLPPQFDALPLEEQLTWLKEGLPKYAPEELLSACAELRDAAPAIWLCTTLAERGFFDKTNEQSFFISFLLGLPDTHIDKLLRALLPVLQRESLSALLIGVIQRAPIERLPAMCVVDRLCKQHIPEEWERYITQQEALALSVLSANEKLNADIFVRLPAKAIERVYAKAQESAKGDDFLLWYQEAATRALEVLQDLPKGVSQSNAEELLSRRVYTDPGHFLIELLQNAEDAQAHHWRVIFERERIIVWHDGLPFDTRDVVGITSIGQTTKRKQQIGFFGVGFKSVYEITERPQLFSGVYSLEIIDISIPKQLASRPQSVPQDGTVLILPLRAPEDPERNALALYHRALALDPCVLFTLRNMQQLTFEHPGSNQVHSLKESHSPRGAFLHKLPGNTTREYLLQEEEYFFEGARIAGRPDSTRVMVGISAQGGVPKAIEAGAATVYSYLPTAEQSGLAFFVQGHFDVPVDRERLTAESAWNQWIISKIPALLKKVAQEISDRPLSTAKLLAARGFCEILPLPSEIKSAIFAPLPKHLAQFLSDVAILPSTDRTLRAPSQMWVAEPALASIFREFQVEGQHLLEPALPQRTREIALLLGAKTLDAESLFSKLESFLAAIDDPAVNSKWAQFIEEKRERLYDFLLGELERRERESDWEGAKRWLETIRNLPLLPGDDGRIYRANEKKLARGAANVRSLISGMLPLLDERLDVDCALMGKPKPSSRTALLIEKLGVPVVNIEDILALIEQQASGKAILASPKEIPFIATEERRIRALELFASAPFALYARALRLPLFLSEDGQLRRAAVDASDVEGLIWVRPGRVGELLRIYYQGARPIVSRSASNAELFLLERARVTALDLDTFSADLKFAYQSPRALRPCVKLEDYVRLHALLEELREEFPSRLRAFIARLPVWLDQSLTGRPLAGEGAVFISKTAGLAPLFQQVPFLDEALAQKKHVEGFGGRGIGLDEAIFSFSPEAEAPLKLEATPAIVELLLPLITRDGAQISHRSRVLFWSLPLAFASTDEGATKKLVITSTLRVSKSEALRGFLRDVHPFLEPSSVTAQALDAIGLREHIKPCELDDLLEHLATLNANFLYRSPEASLPFFTSQEKLSSLLSYLEEQAPSLTRNHSLRLAKLAIFPDHEGRLAYLGDFRRELDRERCYPCEGAVRPLWAAAGLRPLHPEAQSKLVGLLEALHLPLAGAEAAVELMRRRLQRTNPQQQISALQSAENVAQLQALLLSEKEKLAELYPVASRADLPDASPILCRLPIWRTQSGAVLCADELFDTQNLTQLLSATEPNETIASLVGVRSEELKRVVDEMSLDEASLGRLRGLAPLIVPLPKEKLFTALLTRFAKERQPLSAQQEFLSTPEKILALFTLLQKEEVAPLVDVSGCLRLGSLYQTDALASTLLQGTKLGADIAHPIFSGQKDNRLPPLPLSAMLQSLVDEGKGGVEAATHPLWRDESRRQAFYQWLMAHEHQIFSDALCRELLISAPLFVSERGALLRPNEMHFDAQLPSLEIDCRPHPEMPPGVRELLQRYLGAGRLSFDEMLRLHLIPAYQAAHQMPERARGLLAYIAKQAQGNPPALLRDLTYESESGQYHPLSELISPDVALRPTIKTLWQESYPVLSSHYNEDIQVLLFALGLSRYPKKERVEEKLSASLPMEQSIALAGLVGYLHRARPELLEMSLVRSCSWVLDEAERSRKPSELYLRDPEIEALVGDFAELFVHPRVSSFLAESLAVPLGFRRSRDVALEEVIRQISVKQSTKQPLSFRVYLWMELGIEQGWINSAELVESLQGKEWIYSDDNAYFSADKVLGTWAFSYFGERRGYWERGRESCPKLCQLFSIAKQINAQHVTAFLEEIGRDAQQQGDQSLLARERALPRMLQSCYAFLGREQASFYLPQSLPFLLCQRAPTNADNPQHRLLPLSSTGLYRSDAPTLEALFVNAGALFLATTGPVQDREAIERFYLTIGLKQIREAYQISVAPDAGRDVSDSYQEGLIVLRSVLRSFLSVLPRVRKQRALPGQYWVYEARLSPLAASGAIRVVERLRARFVLAGVGETTGEVPSIYDIHRGELFVDAQIFHDPEGALSGLALGLMPSFYQGPGEEQLTDLCEILLPLQTKDRMNAYLDRRHFPTIDAQQSAKELLAERLGELLDFGLAQRLLGRSDLDAWRDRSLLASLEEKPYRALAQDAVPHLLSSLDQLYPIETSNALFRLLTLTSLRELPMGILPNTPQQTEQLRDIDTPISFDVVPVDHEPLPFPVLPIELSDLSAPSPNEEVWQTVDVPKSGIWNRFMRWVRGAPEGPPQYSQPPTWAEEGGNALLPSLVIPSQMWATPQNRARLAQTPSRAKLVYQPTRLPMPHLYAAYTVGVRFDAQTQSWSSIGAPLSSMYAAGQPTGRRITFQGRLMPGVAQLPLPLYSRIAGPVIGNDGSRDTMILAQPDPSGTFQAKLQLEAPMHVRYEVELLEPPYLEEQASAFVGSEALIVPTMARSQLPPEVQQWLAQEASRNRPAWAKALAVREFIKARYRYQDDFLERPEVKRAMSALRPGEGNHHITLLHASADSQVLGVGICYELNMLAVELLRHLHIPAMPVMGWIFDLGEVDRPDHLFALALLSTPDGIGMLPIDAATNARGPIHAVPTTPTPQPRASALPMYPEPTGAWGAHVVPTPQDWSEQLASLQQAEQTRLWNESRELLSVMRRLYRAQQTEEPEELQRISQLQIERVTPSVVSRLREMAKQQLPQQELLQAMLAIERGELQQVQQLTPAVQELVRRGLARVKTVPVFQVLPGNQE